MNTTTNHSLKSSRTRPGALVLLGMGISLIVVTAAPRLWLLKHSEIIAQDGDYFLRMARAMQHDPHSAMREYVVHPGYPAAVLVVYNLLPEQTLADPTARWERAGQIVAFVASVLAVLGVWVFGATIFRDWWIALGGAMVFALGRKFATLGADVLSDSLMLCFAIWALVLAVQASEAFREKRKRAFLWAGATGALAAMAYWVRPEGMVTLLVAISVWGLIQTCRRISWRWLVGIVLIAAGCAIAAAAPYGLSQKWRPEEFTLVSSSPLFACLANGESATPGLLRLVGRFFEAQHPVLGSLTCFYLVFWCLSRTRFGKPLCAVVPGMTYTGAGMILLTWLWISPLLLLRYWSTGAMSHRYLMIPAAMMAGLSVAGIVTIGRLAVMWITPPMKAKRVQQIVVTCLWVGVAGGVTYHALRPLHEGHRMSRNAGLWLKSRMTAEDRLFTDQFYVRYYAGIDVDRGHAFEDSALTTYLANNQKGLTRRDYLVNHLDSAEGYRFVAMTRERGPTLLSMAEPLLRERGYRVVKTFPFLSDGKPKPEKRMIVIFEKQAPATQQKETNP